MYEIDLEGQLKCLESPKDFLIQHSEPFSLEKAVNFLMALRDNVTMKKAAEKALIDIKTVHSWRRLYPDFAARVEEALEDRAYYFEDQMMELLDDEELPSNVLAAKIGAYEKLAKYGNRKRYTDRGKEDGPSGITFIINTGVPDQVPINIEEVIKYEEDKTNQMHGTGEHDSVQGDRSGGDGGDTEWYSFNPDGDSVGTSGDRDGGDPSGDDNDSDRGDSDSSEQSLFGGDGSYFTRRGDGKE